MGKLPIKEKIHHINMSGVRGAKEKSEQDKGSESMHVLGWLSMLNEAVRRGMSEEVTFEQKHEGNEGASHVDIGVGVVLQRRHNQCKGPETEPTWWG